MAIVLALVNGVQTEISIDVSPSVLPTLLPSGIYLLDPYAVKLLATELNMQDGAEISFSAESMIVEVR